MITIYSLSLKIKKRQILKNINIEIQNGLAYGLVGNNGCGKTMLMKCIVGLIKPTEGKVVADGKIIGKDVDFLEDVGLIIENPGFVSFYSGFRNLKSLAYINNKIDDNKIKECMKICGLDPELKLSLKKYSLGMKQRLGIAQAIMEDPQYLILDEPMNGLDKNGVKDVRKILLDLKSSGKTIIMSSHNASDIESICDVVFEMDGGEII